MDWVLLLIVFQPSFGVFHHGATQTLQVEAFHRMDWSYFGEGLTLLEDRYVGKQVAWFTAKLGIRWFGQVTYLMEIVALIWYQQLI